MRFLLIILLFMTACGARKVGKTSSNKLEEINSNVSFKTESTFSNSVIDLSKFKAASTDQTKVFESENTTITADEAEFDSKTGKVNFKGNVNVHHKKQKQTDTDKQSSNEMARDVKAVNVGAKKSDSSSKDKSVKQDAALNKSTESEGSVFYTWWLWVLVVAVLFGGYKLYKLWK